MPTHAAPALVGLGPGPLAGQRFEVGNGYFPLGRARGAFIYIGVAGVEPEHAGLTVNGPSATVEDLGSVAGTFVNGRRIHGSQDLHDGDVVRIAGVEMEFVAAHAAASTPSSPGPGSSPRPAVGFDVGSVHGPNFNAGRDVNYYHQRRENWLREIAATRTRGRVLIGVGAAVFVVGFVMFAAPIVRNLGARSVPRNPFGSEIFGIASGALGWALAAVGVLLTVLGIVLHVVATARRRQADHTMPASGPPSGWSG